MNSGHRRKLTIAIVGGGVGMLAILRRLMVAEVENADIHIFQHQTPGVGEAYKFAPDQLIMNTRNDAITFFDGVIPYRKWLGANNPEFASESGFLPRRIFGQYLSAVRAAIFRRLHSSSCVVHHHAPATHIGPAGEVHTKAESPLSADCTFVSIGFGDVQSYSNLIQRIDRVPRGGLLRVAGTGLSAIDVIVLCQHLRPDVVVNCRSLQGRFPAVRGDFGPSTASIFDLHPGLLVKPCIFRLLNAIRTQCAESNATRDDYRLLIAPNLTLDEEYRYVQTHIPAWQPLLYAGTRHYADFFTKLPVPQRVKLIQHRSRFINRRGMFPPQNAEKLIAMMRDGSLHVSRGQLSGDAVSTGNWVDCRNSASALRAFSERSCFPVHPLLGVDVSMSGKLNDSRRVFVLGPMTNGARYFTEASSITVRQADLAVDAALHSLGRFPNQPRHLDRSYI